MDTKLPGKGKRKITKTMWMDAVNRDLKKVDWKERWRMTGDDSEEPSMTIVATPYDGRSQRKRSSYLTIIELTMFPAGNRLLERLMSPSPKSQVVSASAFS